METHLKNNWFTEFKHKFFNEDQISSRRKLYNTLWAILFGFIVSGIIVGFSGNNPFSIFISMFSNGWSTFGNKFISVFVAYVFASLAVGICFKAGLFNIGISGQMMAGGFITLVIFRSELLTKTAISGGSIVLAIFIAILSGAFISFIAGILKTSLGINEVVSTIMLNWIVFFLIKFFVHDFSTWNGTDFLADANSLASNLSIDYALPSFFYPQDLKNSWYANYWNWIIIVFAILAVFSIWIIMKRTTLGYKIKMVGFNKDASDYSGTNQKTLTLIIMTFSGALAGLAGFIWYFGQGGQMDLSEQPLLAGFDAIAIALLVYNNPIGIFFSSILYGIISVGSQAIPSEFPGLPKEINQIIIGVVIYIAAITIVFSKFKLYTEIKNFIILSRFKAYHAAWVDYGKSRFIWLSLWVKTRIKIFNLWKNNNKSWKSIKKKHHKSKLAIEDEYIKNYSLDKFDLSKMSDSDQLNYFEKLSALKKEIDFELAKKHYFEKNNIKSIVSEYNKKSKYEYQIIKKRYLNQYYEQKGGK